MSAALALLMFARFNIRVASSADDSAAFNPQPWLEDLDQARVAFTEKYADLEWEVFEYGVDLSAVFAECDSECEDRIKSWATDRMTRDLKTTLTSMRSSGAEFLLVDLAGNGGGNNWVDAAARHRRAFLRHGYKWISARAIT
jgi:hypothetical protein